MKDPGLSVTVLTLVVCVMVSVWVLVWLEVMSVTLIPRWVWVLISVLRPSFCFEVSIVTWVATGGLCWCV